MTKISFTPTCIVERRKKIAPAIHAATPTTRIVGTLGIRL